MVYTKPPFAGAAHVLAYLGRYTHKIAIANHRLVDFDGEHVRFRWRDYADGNRRKTMRLHADEFVRRFLSHVLPRGFTRLRHYGLLANRGREDIALGFRVVRRARGWQSVAVAQPRLRVRALTPSTVIGRCTRTRTPKGRLMGTQGKWGGNRVRLGISWTMRVS